MEAHRQSLNGYWKYTINDMPQPPVHVPFSALCCGDSLCETVFDSDQSDYTELCFEGITYKATVELNGVKLGEMCPYSHYSFDISDIVRPTGNRLSVAIRDMNMPFGPSEGWENYGGIIRDVYVNYKNKIHIDEVIWQTETEEPFQMARCSVQVMVKGTASCSVTAVLLGPGNAKAGEATAVADNGRACMEMEVCSPLLWSPESPNLYTLEVFTENDKSVMKVGIKDFRIKGQRFYLNGNPYFLKGINRHDMWGEQGYTLSKSQMEKDMRMIKAMGCNYVRLVHYPHHPYIVELADELGLLISEEPGLWWSDMTNPEVTSSALEVLERVILRDRNHVSIAFWLAFNECVFTPEFLEASSSLCRKLDPKRPVSGANAMEKEMTKELFKKHGFDFYTRHPYTYNFSQFEEEANFLNDMPLVFTEWGGLYVFENGNLFENSMNEIRKAWNRPDGGGVIAGESYWCWADMFEFGRGRIACNEGILNEGLVDINRNPRSNYDRYSKILRWFDIPEEQPSDMQIQPGLPAKGIVQTIKLPATDENDFMSMLDMATPQEGYYHKKTRRLTIGPRLPQSVVEIGGIPVDPATRCPCVASKGKNVVIPIGLQARKLFIFGNVSVPWGYPLYGKKGDIGAKYILHYMDGTDREVLLKNGIDMTTALGQQGPSRIQAMASNCLPAISYSYDKNWEHYIVNRYELDIDAGKTLVSIEIKAMEEKCVLLTYAISAEVK